MINALKQKTNKKQELIESSRKYGLYQSPISLNKEQKNKLNKIIERANSFEKIARVQDEYLLRSKLAQLKKIKEKSNSKQKVYYCEVHNDKPNAFLKKKFQGSKSTKLLGYTKINQEQTGYTQSKLLNKSDKKFLTTQLSSKKLPSKKLIGLGELNKIKKKVSSEEPTRGAYTEGVPIKVKEPASIFQPESLAERLIKHLKNPVPPQLDSFSNSKSHSYLHSMSRDQQTAKMKDETPEKNQNLSTLATQKTKATVHMNIIRKIKAARSGQSMCEAATAIQSVVRGWLARRDYLKLRAMNSSCRRSKEHGRQESDLFKFDQNNQMRNDNIFRRNCLQLKNARGPKGIPISNKESLKPINDISEDPIGKLKHSKSVIDAENGSKLGLQRAHEDVMEALSGEEFCGQTISSRNFSKNTSFKEESPKGGTIPHLRPSEEKVNNKIAEPKSGKKPPAGDNGNFSSFAKEEYKKWRTVSNIAHTLEKQLGEHAAIDIQSMIKQLELFAETSKRNLKDAFLANDSVISNTISENRSSKMNGYLGSNHCFERKVAIKGPKFINFQEKMNTENSVQEDSKRVENSEWAQDSPVSSKKGLGSKRSSKEIVEKWVEPLDKHSISSAYNGINISKSNFILVSQLHINENQTKDMYKVAPTSEKSSPRPNHLSNLFGQSNLISPSKLTQSGMHRSNMSDGLGTPDGQIDLTESFNQVIKRLKDQKLDIVDGQDMPSERKDDHNDFTSEKGENTVSEYEQETSDKVEDIETDERATVNLEHHKAIQISDEKAEDSQPFKNEDKADHITISLLELLIEEALLDANDIVINHQFHGICKAGSSNKSIGYVSFMQEGAQPQIFSIQSIHDYLNRLIEFLIENYRDEILQKLNQGLRLDRLSIIKLVREIEIDLFNNGGTSSLEYASDLVCAIQGKVLDEDWFDSMHPEMRPTRFILTPTSIDRTSEYSPRQPNEMLNVFHHLIYESFNESLTFQWTKDDKIDFVRLLILDKQPLAKQHINEDSLENILYYCRDMVLENSLFGCGIFPEKSETSTNYSRMIDPMLLRQIREERLVKMLGLEVV